MVADPAKLAHLKQVGDALLAGYDAMIEADVLRGELTLARRKLADVWDEGYTAGDRDAATFARERQVGNSTDHLDTTLNPYAEVARG